VEFVTDVNVVIDPESSTPEKLLDAIRNGQVAERWNYLSQDHKLGKIKITKVREMVQGLDY